MDDDGWVKTAGALASRGFFSFPFFGSAGPQQQQEIINFQLTLLTDDHLHQDS